MEDPPPHLPLSLGCCVLKDRTGGRPGLWDLVQFPGGPSKCLASFPVCAHHLSPLLLGWSSGFSEEPKKAKGTSGGYVDCSEPPSGAFACCSPSSITMHTLWAPAMYGKIKTRISSPGPYSLASRPYRGFKTYSLFSRPQDRAEGLSEDAEKEVGLALSGGFWKLTWCSSRMNWASRFGYFKALYP